MKVRAFDYALSISVTAAMLVGCGGSAATTTAIPATDRANALPHQQTFHYTGAEQKFRVPAGVHSLTVVALGAIGGGVSERSGDYFGRGGRVFAVVPVRPGETLHVFVGGEGLNMSGGYNGGANGGNVFNGYLSKGYGGGGASDVREHGLRLKDRIIVAAGGGGEGDYPPNGQGGRGGGEAGGAGGSSTSASGGGGTGGTQSAGGAGGAGGVDYTDGSNGDAGSRGRGGSGGDGACTPYATYCGGGGGGGGGGYYGGGGGGGGGSAFASIYGGVGGGGGGGSSYIEPSAARAETWGGWKKADGEGLVVFSWQ